MLVDQVDLAVFDVNLSVRILKVSVPDDDHRRVGRSLARATGLNDLGNQVGG